MRDFLYSDFWLMPPAGEWWYGVWIFAGLLLLIGLGELLRRFAGVSGEFTRKLIHVTVGTAVSFTPRMFSVPIPAVFLAVLFVFLNLIALRKGWLSSMHASAGDSFGTVYYPLSFLILVLLFWFRSPLIISVSMLVLAFADSAASVVGGLHKSPAVFRLSGDKKSLEGTLAMFIVSFATLWVGVTVFQPTPEVRYDFLFAVAGVGAITATAWEALSSRGLDNLTVPLSVAFILSYYLSEGTDIRQFTTGTGFALFVAVASSRARLLSLSGSVATLLLATVIFGIGGWKWAVPIVVFFLLSSFLSRVGRTRKAALADVFEKSDIRDYSQVFANGGIAGVTAILSFVFPSYDFYPLYVGSIAAVTADTWGTEIGLLGSGQTVMITTLRPIAAGRNGGVTWLGLLAGAGGGLVIGFSALAWTGDLFITAVFALAGLVGTLVDSLMGATLQAEFKCPVCGKITERKTHCTSQPTIHVRGFRWMNNEAVNWMCAATGAIAAGLLRLAFVQGI